MAQGLKLFAEIIPDTKDLQAKLKGQKFRVEGEVEKQKGLGLGGTAMGTGMGMAMGMGMFSIIQKIVGFLSGLEPIQAIMEIIGAIMKLFFLPLALMLFTLLRPILIPMLKLMPMWMEFWKDPVGNLVPLIKKLGEFIWGGITGIVKAMPGAIGKAVEMHLKLPEMVLKFFGIDIPLAKAGGLIAEAMVKLIVDWIKDWVIPPLNAWTRIQWAILTLIGRWVGSWIIKPLNAWLHVQGAIFTLIGRWVDTWTPVEFPDILGSVKSGLGEIGDIIMDGIAGVVKTAYDWYNAIPLLPNFEYPNWVKKQLNLGEYAKEEEKPLFVGSQESPYGPTYYPQPTGETIPEGAWNPYATPYYTPVEDFVLSRGKLYKTHPEDTIAGTRGGFNAPVVNLTINGVMSDELLRDALQQLRRQMERGY